MKVFVVVEVPALKTAYWRRYFYPGRPAVGDRIPVCNASGALTSEEVVRIEESRTRVVCYLKSFDLTALTPEIVERINAFGFFTETRDADADADGASRVNLWREGWPPRDGE